ncbi:hypothetical protein B0T11DRAFT_279941 [Plectosphaerella cucumerina]|uniref:GDP/GTP exchange factor Sec2 N-terminal domain-containing protein n=1 Tax=Plectosphaerella cucumerina TaxID=40658 RepID=A0A8K0TH41_9PEZI|nr:hypothetical protein B0T11DRAFT_279941 [Plectosphaerella cucumerina]
MSSTATMTTTAAAPLPTLSLSLSAACCPSCGLDLPVPSTPSIHNGKVEGEAAAASLLEAQARIADLEAQVRLLNQKASAAIDRWADYEDELARLRSQRAASEPPHPQQVVAVAASTGLPSPSPTRSSFLPSSAGGVANRLSALLSRKSTPALRPQSIAASSAPNLGLQDDNEPPSTPDTPSHPLNQHADLLSALRHEKNLRLAAESRLSTTSQEVEELSVSLFEQANEMVATERRARAQLAERVEILEKRDSDKRRRLERLEGAVGRIDRVRKLLGDERIGKPLPNTPAVDAPITTENEEVESKKDEE